MRFDHLALLIIGVLTAPAFADPVTDRIDQARALYLRGALAEAAGLLGSATLDVQTRLGRALAELMPSAPLGWEAAEPRISPMGALGGLTVSRDYRMGGAAMDAAVVVGSPAVAGVAALVAEPGALAAQPGLRRVRIGDQDALLRWEPSTRSGQLTMVVGREILLQVVGRGLSDGEEMVALMRSWDAAAVTARAGLSGR